jgi:glucose/arabinose dehydrogenase
MRADRTIVATPFATVTVVAGAERGLIGLALAPDFAVSGHLFVYASVPAGGGKPDRNQVIRFTAVGDSGTSPFVIVDDLPHAAIHNAGDLQFGPDGKLYVSVGDSADSALPQADGSLAGRILRYNADGTIPADNPDPASPEWCRGLRNSFDLAFHPTAGGLFATENGPTFGDEVNYIQRDRNYEWKDLPPGFPGARIGLRIIEWTPVIAPTGLVFHSGNSFGPEYANNLFVLGYVDADIRRLALSGSAFTDLDEEIPFATFEDSGVANKPLDAVEAPDGSLWVSTFSGIWRFERW